MTPRFCLLGLLLPTLAFATDADPEKVRAMQVKLMEETKIIAVTEISVPSSEYKSDGDPSTLEIVFLKRRKDGPSRVSDDGEVIFLYRPSDKEQQTLITKAFEIRARKRLEVSN